MPFRMTGAYLAVSKAGLLTKEKLFVVIAWMPKATVQAALGGVVAGLAEDLNSSKDVVETGKVFLTVAVFCILITAPIGAVLTALLGKKLLTKGEEPAVKGPVGVFSNRIMPDLRAVTEWLSSTANYRYNSLFRGFSSIPENEVEQAFEAVRDKTGNKVTALPRAQSLPYRHEPIALELLDKEKKTNGGVS